MIRKVKKRLLSGLILLLHVGSVWLQAVGPLGEFEPVDYQEPAQNEQVAQQQHDEEDYEQEPGTPVIEVGGGFHNVRNDEGNDPDFPAGPNRSVQAVRILNQPVVAKESPLRSALPTSNRVLLSPAQQRQAQIQKNNEELVYKTRVLEAGLQKVMESEKAFNATAGRKGFLETFKRIFVRFNGPTPEAKQLATDMDNVLAFARQNLQSLYKTALENDAPVLGQQVQLARQLSDCINLIYQKVQEMKYESSTSSLVRTTRQNDAKKILDALDQNTRVSVQQAQDMLGFLEQKANTISTMNVGSDLVGADSTIESLLAQWGKGSPTKAVQQALEYYVPTTKVLNTPANKINRFITVLLQKYSKASMGDLEEYLQSLRVPKTYQQLLNATLVEQAIQYKSVIELDVADKSQLLDVLRKGGNLFVR